MADDFEIIPARVSWLYIYNRLNESDKKKFLKEIQRNGGWKSYGGYDR